MKYFGEKSFILYMYKIRNVENVLFNDALETWRKRINYLA